MNIVNEVFLLTLFFESVGNSSNNNISTISIVFLKKEQILKQSFVEIVWKMRSVGFF